MTRVFRNRAAAEADGFHVRTGSPAQAYREVPVKNSPRIRLKYVGDVRTPLEAQLAAALEAVEFITARTFYQQGTFCPCCFEAPGAAHRDDCKLSLALKAFRGETP